MILPQMVVHHPETPLAVKLGQFGKFVSYFSVFGFSFDPIVVNRGAQGKQDTSLPQAHIVFGTGVIDQLPFFSRSQSFFSMTSLSTWF